MNKIKLVNKDTRGTMEIKSNVNEQSLMESCLNYYHTGYDYKIILLFYALAHKWNVDKFIYYVNLIEGKKGGELLE